MRNYCILCIILLNYCILLVTQRNRKPGELVFHTKDLKSSWMLKKCGNVCLHCKCWILLIFQLKVTFSVFSPVQMVLLLSHWLKVTYLFLTWGKFLLSEKWGAALCSVLSGVLLIGTLPVCYRSFWFSELQEANLISIITLEVKYVCVWGK